MSARGLHGRPSPASLIANRINDGHADDVFQLLELADDGRAVRPWAGPRDIEMVAPFRGRLARAPISRDMPTKGVLLAREFALS